MTSLNPSHNIFRTPQGRHAQAVHDPQTQSQVQDEIESEDETTFLSEREKAERRAKREARRRVRANAPSMPDLRFEQVSLGFVIWGISFESCSYHPCILWLDFSGSTLLSDRYRLVHFSQQM